MYEISFISLLEKVTWKPAQIFNLGLRGDFAPGYVGDIVIVDPNKRWKVTEKSLLSKGKNTPFLNRTLPGVVELTIKNGKIVYRGDNVD